MTLILSASDFTVYNSAGTVLGTITDQTGSARLHADIDSAAKGYDSGSLPSSSYCREYNDNDIVTASNMVAVTISGSVEGGAYSGSLGDNAVSLRCWMRNEHGNPKSYLFIKNQNGAGQLTSTGTSYYLEFGTNSSAFKLKSGATGLLDLPNVAVDEWHRVRFDYIPVASMKDVINVYTSSAGGTNTETWELVGTHQILDVDSAYITSSLTTLTMGYGAKGFSSAGGRVWFDDFDVYVTPAG
jgi:hypothetical protein